MRVLLIAIASLMFVSGSAFADGHGTLARSGVINFHTGWTCEYPTTPGSNDTAVGGASCKGYTFLRMDLQPYTRGLQGVMVPLILKVT